jgi:arylformamidase
MSETVFLHYTQRELDRNFDQRGWVSNALEVIQRFAERSARTRARLEHRANVAYGSAPDEMLDIFPAPRSAGHVQVFMHGGAWKNFSKNDYSFPADAFVPAGVHTVVVNFTNLPGIRLPQMVDQVRRSLEWIYRNARSFGGDPNKLYLSAQSSWAHLSACALQTDWATRGVPADFIKAATLVSGPYYLEPVVLSARSAYVKLEPDEVLALSPGLHARRMPCPVMLGYAERDTDEFQRQTRAFASALSESGKLTKLTRFDAVNHFELMECFGKADHALVRDILAQMGIGVRAGDASA